MTSVLRLFLLVAAVACAVLLPARADSVDEVKEKLFQAKKEYDGEVRKFRTAVTEALDKREDAARKAGDKKALDAVKGDRARFEKDGEPPANALGLAQVRGARGKLDKAYSAAVKDLIRLKEDAAAESVEKEQQKFALESTIQFGKRTYLVTLKHFDVKAHGAGGFSNNGTFGTLKYKFEGEFASHSIFAHVPPDGNSQVSYTLGGKWTAMQVTVGIPKLQEDAGNPEVGMTFEVVGDGKTLWKSEPVTKIETYQVGAVSVSKVKTLTLRVNCPGNNAWGRTVWFEPILVE